MARPRHWWTLADMKTTNMDSPQITQRETEGRNTLQTPNSEASSILMPKQRKIVQDKKHYRPISWKYTDSKILNKQGVGVGEGAQKAQISQIIKS